MAKRKKNMPRRRTKRRVGSIDTGSLLMVIAGAVGSEFLGKVLPDLDPKLLNGGKIALGFVAPMVVSDAKTKQMLSALGSGMAASGAVGLLKSMGVLSGVEDDLELTINGDDLPTVNGEDLPTVNGENSSVLNEYEGFL